jgi:hypothetical protein
MEAIFISLAITSRKPFLLLSRPSSSSVSPTWFFCTPRNKIPKKRRKNYDKYGTCVDASDRKKRSDKFIELEIII